MRLWQFAGWQQPTSAIFDRVAAPTNHVPRFGAHHPHPGPPPDRKSTRLNSSHSQISYAVFCLKKKKIKALVARARQADDQYAARRPHTSAPEGRASLATSQMGSLHFQLSPTIAYAPFV